jgi:hypothetical protein
VGANTRYRKQLEEVKKNTGIKDVVYIPSLEHGDFVLSDTIVYDKAGPKEFIKLIELASLVCTDSFHATVLSLIIERPFVEFLRFSDEDMITQNSRIYDLLNLFNLECKIYEKNSPLLYKSIDFKAVREVIQHERKRCVEYLRNSIEQ